MSPRGVSPAHQGWPARAGIRRAQLAEPRRLLPRSPLFLALVSDIVVIICASLVDESAQGSSEKGGGRCDAREDGVRPVTCGTWRSRGLRTRGQSRPSVYIRSRAL